MMAREADIRSNASQPLADAADPYAAFARGDYETAALSARKLPLRESRIVLARIALRERRPDEALELLTKWRGPVEPILDAERNLLIATSCERVGRSDEAAALYEIALPRGASRSLQNERLYLRALGHWMRGEQDAAERLISLQQPGHGTSIALGKDLLGWIAVARREYAGAAAHFREAHELFEASGYPDEGARVNCLLSLAIVGVETIDLAVCEGLAQEYARAPRTPWLRKRVCHLGQYLVRMYALAGDDSAAFALANELVRAAEGPDETLSAHVAIAEFLRLRGDTVAPRLHLDLAAKEIRSAKWSKSDADDAMAALLYCVEASYLDPAGAADALTRVLSANGSADALLSFEHDSRARALALYARGRVAIGMGNPAQGEALVRRALEIWGHHGYRYRMAIAALDLAAVFDDAEALEAASRIVPDVPRSWLARSERRIAERVRSGLADLSRAERRVLRYLGEGRSNREIAEVLQRSESTIRNQTQRIFDVLGINSRAALAARCAEWER